ncbi:hypothetical protein HPB47_006062 [Ixodes persulcatus]|uniref:Uncharacterized protein n=1 Tax=Ixodes persulcatus TaxID=34615 RepID=A0AC60PBD6_IXOPE|nr:hypothetical protein HPB47_006062 [Ixodes persulcatus]
MLTQEQEAAMASTAEVNLLTKVTEMSDSAMQRLALTPGQQENPSASEVFTVGRIVPLALQASAWCWLGSHGPFISLADFQTRLREEFLPAGYATQILRELKARTQHPDESLVRMDKLQRLCKRERIALTALIGNGMELGRAELRVTEDDNGAIAARRSHVGPPPPSVGQFGGPGLCDHCRRRPQRTVATWMWSSRGILHRICDEESSTAPRRDALQPTSRSRSAVELSRPATAQSRLRNIIFLFYFFYFLTEELRLHCPLCGVSEMCSAAHIRGQLHVERVDAVRIARINRLGERALERAVGLMACFRSPNIRHQRDPPNEDDIDINMPDS